LRLNFPELLAVVVLPVAAGCAQPAPKAYTQPVIYPAGHAAQSRPAPSAGETPFQESSSPVDKVTTGLFVRQADFDGDGKAKDGIALKVIPLSSTGRTVRKLGRVRVALYRRDFDNLDLCDDVVLIEWIVEREDLARTWKSGAFGSGGAFHLRLAWPAGQPNVRWAVLKVFFEDTSGAVFAHTEPTVRIRG